MPGCLRCESKQQLSYQELNYMCAHLPALVPVQKKVMVFQ